MPSFTGTIPNLVATGPNVEVFFAIPPNVAALLQQAGNPVPPPVRVIAQVDTGASGTVVNPSIIQALQALPVSSTQISTPTTANPVTANVYDLALIIPNGITLPSVFAVESVLGGQNIQALIGRDVLQHGVLIYTGYINQFTLSF